MTLPARSRPRALVPRTTARDRLPAWARPRLPAGVRDRLPAWAHGFAARRAEAARLRTLLRLEPRERLLVTARRIASGQPCLALSDRALYYRGNGSDDRDGGDAGWTRLGWERVVRVGWDPAGRLVFDTAVPYAGARDAIAPDYVVPRTRHVRVSVPVQAKGSVPEIAMERAGHTRLGTRRVTFPGGGQMRVEARRRPVTGELLWLVVPEAGTPDLSDSELRQQAAPVLARLSAEFGLPGQPAAGLAVPAPRPPRASVSVPRTRHPADDQRPLVTRRRPATRV